MMEDSSRRMFVHALAVALLLIRFGPVEVARAETSKPQGEPTSPVASVRYLGNQFLKNKVDVTGADGATSFVLPSKESLWMFGDTVEGPFKTIRGLVAREVVGEALLKLSDEYLEWQKGQRILSRLLVGPGLIGHVPETFRVMLGSLGDRMVCHGQALLQDIFHYSTCTLANWLRTSNAFLRHISVGNTKFPFSTGIFF